MDYQYLFGAFFLASAFIGAFLCAILVAEKNMDAARKLLVALLLVIVLVLFSAFFVSVKLYRIIPHGLFIFGPLWLAFPALLFLYTQFSTGQKTRFRMLDGLHFAPVAIYIALNYQFYLLPAEAKIRIGDFAYSQSGKPGLFSIFFFGQSSLYLIWIKCRQKKRVGMRANWLNALWKIWAAVVVFDGALSLLILTHGYNVSFYKGLTIFFYSFITFFTAYQLLKKPLLFFTRSNGSLAKYHSTTVSLDQLEHLAERARSLMESEQVFLDANLRQQSLAERLETNTVVFSQMLNTVFRQNFNEWVNTYRARYAEKLIRQGYLEKFSADALAEQSGYGSKASFYRSFKKCTGKTPLEFQKEIFSRN
ncbi:MAG: helix-turn-helix domain-containing protein [Lewinellaceae bacterium]|nr:helix-turn-helix domain-containing protein [Lewinellaceae bacterium]